LRFDFNFEAIFELLQYFCYDFIALSNDESAEPIVDYFDLALMELNAENISEVHTIRIAIPYKFVLVADSFDFFHYY